jgi:hypothetical protein
MSEPSPDAELTSDLDPWNVTLKTGHVLTVWAHAVSQQDGHWVFVALMKGEPAYERDLLRVPEAIVSEVLGGA